MAEKKCNEIKKDHRSALAKLLDEWLESDEGIKCAEGSILKDVESAMYLKNRIHLAFLAGANAMGKLKHDENVNLIIALLKPQENN